MFHLEIFPSGPMQALFSVQPSTNTKGLWIYTHVQIYANSLSQISCHMWILNNISLSRCAIVKLQHLHSFADSIADPHYGNTFQHTTGPPWTDFNKHGVLSFTRVFVKLLTTSEKAVLRHKWFSTKHFISEENQ